jgi:peptidoglycan/LPS O-acetylase OafA/YrhL
MNVRADHFPLVDSLRALAALGVVAFHAALFAGVPRGDTPLTPYTAHLDVGVTVFFLISGFLLYRPYVRARAHELPAPPLASYAWRRFLRIVPAYWVALTVVAVALGLSEVFTASGIATYYGFAQIYSAGTAGGGIDQAWTLCVEVTFYALLPLWALLVGRVARGRRLLAVELGGLALLAAGSLAYKAVAVMHVDPGSLSSAPWLMPLPNFLDDFAIGMAVAVASVHYEGRRELPRPLALIARYPELSWLVAALAFWAVSTQIGWTGVIGEPITRAMFMEKHVLYAIVALGILLPAAFGDPEHGWVRRLLRWRPLLYVGLVSYGLYLYHLAVLTAFNRRWHDRLVELLPSGLGWRIGGFLAIGIAGGLALASASYYLVERPALKLKGRVGGIPEQAREEAVAEPAPMVPRA